MPNVYINDIDKYQGEEVTIRGWLYNKRSSGKIHFLLIRDGTGIIQGVLSKAAVDEETFAIYDIVTQESSIMVTGKVRADFRAPGGYELSISKIQMVQLAQEYPITPKEHGIGFLMDHRHLWLRSSRQHAILRIRSELIRACRDFFDERGFHLLDAPILTPSACEGTTTLFETDYFEDQKAYLSQSGQLYCEAGAMAFGKVYCFGPTFRAEKSKTRRHLTEFWMIEPEVAYATLEDIMILAEEFVQYIVDRILDKKAKELQVLERDLEPLGKVKAPFFKITYEEALEILRSRGEEIVWGDDFGGSHETILSQAFERPLMIHHYPESCKAFYMKNDPERKDLVLCVDMLAPEGYGEIIGGSQREEDLDVLIQKIKNYNLPQDKLEWYLDLRRYGSAPHSGFGLGIERTLAWICGLKHVRETIPFPRMLEKLYP